MISFTGVQLSFVSVISPTFSKVLGRITFVFVRSINRHTLLIPLGSLSLLAYFPLNVFICQKCHLRLRLFSSRGGGGGGRIGPDGPHEKGKALGTRLRLTYLL